MAKNEVFRPGTRLAVPVPAGVVSGDVVVVNKLIGIAQIDRQADGFTTIDTIGVYEVTTADAVASYGLDIYAVVAAGLVTSVTTTASGNTRIGVSMSTKGAGAGKLRVALRQPA